MTEVRTLDFCINVWITVCILLTARSGEALVSETVGTFSIVFYNNYWILLLKWQPFSINQKSWGVRICAGCSRVMFGGNRHSASSLMCILKKWWRARGKSNRSHRNESYQQTATVPSASGLAVSPCQSTNSSGLLSATSSQPSSGKHTNLGNRKTQPRRADKSMEPNSNLLSSNNNNKKLS